MRRGILLILVANVLGGITYPLQKGALEGLPPATVTLLRSALGTALMAGWLAARREPLWPFERRETGRLALLGVVGIAVPILVGAEGIARSTAANASILVLLETPSLVLFAHLLLGERIGARGAAGLALGVAGALAVVTEGATAGPTLLRGEHLLGNALLAASGLLWGLYTPLMKPLVARRSPTVLTFGAMVFALLLMLPAAALEAPRWEAGPRLGSALLCTAALGVAGSFLGTVLWTAALRDLAANEVAPLILLQPVIGAGAGALLLGETLTAQALVGGALVAVGAVVCLSGEPKGG